MRAYLPSIKQAKSNGDRRRQTRYAQLSPGSTNPSLKNWFPEIFPDQADVDGAWIIPETAQTNSQKNVDHGKPNYILPNQVSRQQRKGIMQVGSPIDLDPTASTASSSDCETAENSPRAHVSNTFHLDIAVVKSTARTNESSQDYEECFSKASSSTISSQSTTYQLAYPRQSDRNVVVQPHMKHVNPKQLVKKKIYQNDFPGVFGEFLYPNLDGGTMKQKNKESSLTDDAWGILTFPEKKDRIKQEVDEPTWITFADDPFAPFQQANQLDSSITTMNDLRKNREKSTLKLSCITESTCTTIKHRNPREKDHSKPHSNLQLLSAETNSGSFQRYFTTESRIKAYEVEDSPQFSGSTKAPIHISKAEATTTTQRPKIGKLTNNTTFLSNMLQNKMGNGNTDDNAVVKATKSDDATRRNNGGIIQSANGIKTASHVKSVEPTTKDPQPQTQRSPKSPQNKNATTSRLSDMLQSRKASKAAQSTVPKSLAVDLQCNKPVSEPQLPTTQLSDTNNAIPVEWDDLSEQAFTARLSADTAEFGKYSKMLQVGLPMAVVKNAMQRDGIVLRSAKAKKHVVADGDAASKSRFRIHWTVHNNVRSNTLWAMIQRERHWLQDVVLEEAELAFWFQKKDATVQRTESARPETKVQQRGVIDPKRANNCGILLATIKMSYAEIAQVIDHYALDKLNLTQMNGLSQCLPTKEEAAALQTSMLHTKPAMEKSECERFMVEMMRVQNAKEKLDAMSFLKRLPTRLGELVHDFALLRQAGEEIMNSSSLRKILGLVLHLGNRVHGSGTNDTRAITLGSLAQLNKTCNGNCASFLECVVCLLQRHAPAILKNYKSEFAQTLPQCSGISWNESLKELEAFRVTVTALPSTVPVPLIETAKFRLKEMEEPAQSTASVLDQLVHFFGEDGARSFDTILPLLQQFCVDLDTAIQRVQRRSS